jgi:hypothetical protein
LGETKIIIISRRWPQALLQKFQLIFQLSHGRLPKRWFGTVKLFSLKKSVRKV